MRFILQFLGGLLHASKKNAINFKFNSFYKIILTFVDEDTPSAVGFRTVRGLEEVISGWSFPHIVQCVETITRILTFVAQNKYK
jgi:hypothetical protein